MKKTNNIVEKQKEYIENLVSVNNEAKKKLAERNDEIQWWKDRVHELKVEREQSEFCYKGMVVFSSILLIALSVKILFF